MDTGWAVLKGDKIYVDTVATTRRAAMERGSKGVYTLNLCA